MFGAPGAALAAAAGAEGGAGEAAPEYDVTASEPSTTAVTTLKTIPHRRR